MTAYLQPGDMIHLAFGYSRRIGETDQEAAKRTHDELAGIYSQVGVQITGSSGSSELKHPVVISVIRTKEQPRTQGKLKLVEDYDQDLPGQ